MKKFILILALFAGFLAWQSCEYDWVEAEPINPSDTLSFSAEIIPIFERGCNASVCHGAGGKDPILTRDQAYDNLVSGGYVDTTTPENSSIYTSMAPGGSMSGYSETGDAEKVLIWIQQGALNN
jgi:hypothetical protein